MTFEEVLNKLFELEPNMLVVKNKSRHTAFNSLLRCVVNNEHKLSEYLEGEIDIENAGQFCRIVLRQDYLKFEISTDPNNSDLVYFRYRLPIEVQEPSYLDERMLDRDIKYIPKKYRIFGTSRIIASGLKETKFYEIRASLEPHKEIIWLQDFYTDLNDWRIYRDPYI